MTSKPIEPSFGNAVNKERFVLGQHLAGWIIELPGNRYYWGLERQRTSSWIRRWHGPFADHGKAYAAFQEAQRSTGWPADYR